MLFAFLYLVIGVTGQVPLVLPDICQPGTCVSSCATTGDCPNSSVPLLFAPSCENSVCIYDSAVPFAQFCTETPDSVLLTEECYPVFGNFDGAPCSRMSSAVGCNNFFSIACKYQMTCEDQANECYDINTQDCTGRCDTISDCDPISGMQVSNCGPGNGCEYELSVLDTSGFNGINTTCEGGVNLTSILSETGLSSEIWANSVCEGIFPSGGSNSPLIGSLGTCVTLVESECLSLGNDPLLSGIQCRVVYNCPPIVIPTPAPTPLPTPAPTPVPTASPIGSNTSYSECGFGGESCPEGSCTALDLSSCPMMGDLVVSSCLGDRCQYEKQNSFSTPQSCADYTGEELCAISLTTFSNLTVDCVNITQTQCSNNSVFPQIEVSCSYQWTCFNGHPCSVGSVCSERCSSDSDCGDILDFTKTCVSGNCSYHKTENVQKDYFEPVCESSTLYFSCNEESMSCQSPETFCSFYRTDPFIGVFGTSLPPNPFHDLSDSGCLSTDATLCTGFLATSDTITCGFTADCPYPTTLPNNPFGEPLEECATNCAGYCSSDSDCNNVFYPGDESVMTLVGCESGVQFPDFAGDCVYRYTNDFTTPSACNTVVSGNPDQTCLAILGNLLSTQSQISRTACTTPIFSGCVGSELWCDLAWSCDHNETGPISSAPTPAPAPTPTLMPTPAPVPQPTPFPSPTPMPTPSPTPVCSGPNSCTCDQTLLSQEACPSFCETSQDCVNTELETLLQNSGHSVSFECNSGLCATTFSDTVSGCTVYSEEQDCFDRLLAATNDSLVGCFDYSDSECISSGPYVSTLFCSLIVDSCPVLENTVPNCLDGSLCAGSCEIFDQNPESTCLDLQLYGWSVSQCYPTGQCQYENTGFPNSLCEDGDVSQLKKRGIEEQDSLYSDLYTYILGKRPKKHSHIIEDIELPDYQYERQIANTPSLVEIEEECQRLWNNTVPDLASCFIPIVQSSGCSSYSGTSSFVCVMISTCTDSGCDGIPGSSAQYDACDICEGDGSSCEDCDGIPNGPSVYDICGICNGSGDACLDCEGTLFGTAVYDGCDVCDGDGSSCMDCQGIMGGSSQYDMCDICGGDDTSCADCSSVPNGPSVYDECDVCEGDGTSCLDCQGIPNGPAVYDPCDVCGGGGESCIGCDGVSGSGLKFSDCGECGGDDQECDDDGCEEECFGKQVPYLYTDFTGPRVEKHVWSEDCWPRYLEGGQGVYPENNDQEGSFGSEMLLADDVYENMLVVWPDLTDLPFYHFSFEWESASLFSEDPTHLGNMVSAVGHKSDYGYYACFVTNDEFPECNHTNSGFSGQPHIAIAKVGLEDSDVCPFNHLVKIQGFGGYNESINYKLSITSQPSSRGDGSLEITCSFQNTEGEGRCNERCATIDWIDENPLPPGSNAIQSYGQGGMVYESGKPVLWVKNAKLDVCVNDPCISDEGPCPQNGAEYQVSDTFHCYNNENFTDFSSHNTSWLEMSPAVHLWTAMGTDGVKPVDLETFAMPNDPCTFEPGSDVEFFEESVLYLGNVTARFSCIEGSISNNVSVVREPSTPCPDDDDDDSQDLTLGEIIDDSAGDFMAVLSNVYKNESCFFSRSYYACGMSNDLLSRCGKPDPQSEPTLTILRAQIPHYPLMTDHLCVEDYYQYVANMSCSDFPENERRYPGHCYPQDGSKMRVRLIVDQTTAPCPEDRNTLCPAARVCCTVDANLDGELGGHGDRTVSFLDFDPLPAGGPGFLAYSDGQPGNDMVFDDLLYNAAFAEIIDYVFIPETLYGDGFGVKDAPSPCNEGNCSENRILGMDDLSFYSNSYSENDTGTVNNLDSTECSTECREAMLEFLDDFSVHFLTVIANLKNPIINSGMEYSSLVSIKLVHQGDSEQQGPTIEQSVANWLNDIELSMTCACRLIEGRPLNFEEIYYDGNYQQYDDYDGSSGHTCGNVDESLREAKLSLHIVHKILESFPSALTAEQMGMTHTVRIPHNGCYQRIAWEDSRSETSDLDYNDWIVDQYIWHGYHATDFLLVSHIHTLPLAHGTLVDHTMAFSADGIIDIVSSSYTQFDPPLITGDSDWLAQTDHLSIATRKTSFGEVQYGSAEEDSIEIFENVYEVSSFSDRMGSDLVIFESTLAVFGDLNLEGLNTVDYRECAQAMYSARSTIIPGEIVSGADSATASFQPTVHQYILRKDNNDVLPWIQYSLSQGIVFNPETVDSISGNSWTLTSESPWAWPREKVSITDAYPDSIPDLFTWFTDPANTVVTPEMISWWTYVNYMPGIDDDNDDDDDTNIFAPLLLYKSFSGVGGNCHPHESAMSLWTCKLNIEELAVWPHVCSNAGLLVDFDKDGYSASSDCNDFDTAIHPGAPEKCNGVDDNCNGEVDEGFLLDSNPYHCGACGNQCEVYEVCEQGLCLLNSDPKSYCDLGFAECDGGDIYCCPGCDSYVGIPINTEDPFFPEPQILNECCETPTRNNAFNCGGCGIVCGGDTPYCVDEICVAVCPFGFSECDGDLTDSCETMILEDNENCGGCGCYCSLQCTMGSCVFPLYYD